MSSNFRILPILLLFMLTNHEVVIGLDCYATNLEELWSTRNVISIKQECKQIIMTAYLLQQHSPISFESLDALDDADLRCYNVYVEGGGTDINVKGCLPKGGCETMKAVFIKMMIGVPHSGQNATADCYECNSDGCNVYSSASSVRENVFVVTLTLTLFLVYMNST